MAQPYDDLRENIYHHLHYHCEQISADDAFQLFNFGYESRTAFDADLDQLVAEGRVQRLRGQYFLTAEEQSDLHPAKN